MAARGSIAKTNVTNKIAIAFGNDFVGEDNKKLYVWADDGGQKVQIAISLTCPKNPLQVEDTSYEAQFGWDFSDDAAPVNAAPPKSTTEITPEELEKVSDMMAKLGL